MKELTFVAVGRVIVAQVEKAGRIVGPERSNTHGWLQQLQLAASPAYRANLEQSTATSLLSQSSSFFGDVDEAYLLDPERRRRLKSSATADGSGARHVQLVSSSDHISGVSALQSR